MSNPNTALLAPAIAGPAGTPPAAGTLSPASPAAAEPGKMPVLPPPLSTASIAAAISRQLAGEPYNLSPIPTIPTSPAAAPTGQEPSPEPAPDAGHSDNAERGMQNAELETDSADPEPDPDPTTGGNPAFARLRIEAKEAKAKLKQSEEQLAELKVRLEKLEAKDNPEPGTPNPELETRNAELTVSMPDLPELRAATQVEATQSQVVQWARKAVSTLERAQRGGTEAEALAALRLELGTNAASLPQDPAQAIEWLDDLHSGAQDRLHAARVQKEVLSREVRQAAIDVREESRAFAEAVMPAVFQKDSPESKLVSDARQLFPGIDKNPWFFTWVVKAIRGHQAIEAELAAKQASGNGHAPKPALRTVQIPGAKPTARFPGATSHLPARPAEAAVSGSSHWMGQMKAAKTPAERDAAKAEWQKALAQEVGGRQPQAA